MAERVLPADREPHFFGSPGARLFGCYHPPHGVAGHASAVLLCYPMGQEYIRSHRSFLQLAIRLARAGRPVLRFDPRGTGDSEGEIGDGRLAAWLEDTHRACDHLRRRSGAASVALVGLRLGAALAWLAARERGDVDALVLWDPVASGHAYLEELRREQRRLLRTAYVDVGAVAPPEGPEEVLGFPLTDALRGDLETLDLLAGAGAPRADALIVESTRDARPGGAASALAGRLRNAGAVVEVACVDAPRIWREEPFRGLVPGKVIACIERWLSRSAR